jgi:hypothetical protein
MPEEEKHETKAEEKHEGVATRIRERLHEAKESTKEKVNPWSKTHKAERKETREHKAEIYKAQREAYKKEEIHQAAESGKKAAQKRYAPREHPQVRHVAGQAQKFAKGASTGFGSGILGRGSSGYYDMSFGGMVGPKKKPKPERVTTVNPRTGKVTIREPVEEKKKEPPHEAWNSFDMLTVPEYHTAHSINPFDIETQKPHQLPKRKGKSKRRTAPKRKWQLGDLM